MEKPGSKALATWATFVCSLVLIALLVHKMAGQDRPWTFVVDVPPALPAAGPAQIERQVISPVPEADFVHGASAVATPGGMQAFWYRARYEGATNAELITARLDGSQWSPTRVVTNSSTVSRDAGIAIKSLANPVPFRRSANEIWLFFTASRLSGWATCEIMLMRSMDDGQTWGPAERLYASPFLNMSHLTKATPILLSEGRIGLPAYHEMNRKYPVLLVLNKDGRVIDRRRMGDGGKVGYQPSIVVTGPNTALAFVRRLKNSRHHNVMVSRTVDGGQTWSVPEQTAFPNPGGPISAIRYDDTRILFAFNDDGDYEANIKLAFSNLDGTSLQRIGTIAQKDANVRTDGVMYPYLISSEPGQFDVVYSRPGKAIDHVRVSNGWLQENFQLQAAQK